MKRIWSRCLFLAMFILFLALATTTPSIAAPEQAKTLREFLIADKNAGEVYPIDENHTFVVPEAGMISVGISGEFRAAFFKYCTGKGAMEARFKMADPLTGKEGESWQAITLDEKNTFAHPRTGNREKFTPDMLYKGIVVEGDGEVAPMRIKDFMEVIEVFKTEKGEPRAFIIRTKAPQPFLYRIGSIPELKNIALPADGNLTKTVKEIGESRKGGMFKSGPTQKDADLFVFLSALCVKDKLAARYAVNEGEFVTAPNASLKYFVNNTWQNGYYGVKIKEIESPLEMFKYMGGLDNGRNRLYIWYFWSEGAKKFLSRGAEERTVDEKEIVTSRFTTVFAKNRGRDDVPFTKKETAPALVPVEKSEAKAPAVTKDVPTEEQVKTPEAVKKETAPALVPVEKSEAKAPAVTKDVPTEEQVKTPKAEK